jgi:hypothetical protein
MDPPTAHAGRVPAPSYVALCAAQENHAVMLLSKSHKPLTLAQLGDPHTAGPQYDATK